MNDAGSPMGAPGDASFTAPPAGDTGRAPRPARGHGSPSIRSALMLAVALSLAPALALIIWTGMEHGAHLADSAREETLRQAESFANIQVRVTESARQILSTMSSLPGIRGGDYAQADAILKAVHRRNPEYLNFTLTDAAGVVRASSRLSPGVDLSDRRHIRSVMEGQRFSPGEYIVGIVDSEPSFTFSHSVEDSGGRTVGVMSATFKLSSYAAIFESLDLPPGAILGLVDRNGKRLFFHPPKETNPVGGGIKESVWTGINSGGDSGILTDLGSDDVLRYYAYRRLRMEASAEPYMYVVYALPAAASYGLSRSILLRNIGLIFLVAAFAMASSGLLSRRLFGARLARIIAVTARLRRGDLGARVGFDGDRSDLGQIASALDRMAGTIESRDAEVAENTRKLEASLSEKDVLLREVHHRVKNNLQLIMSLFSLQESESESPAEFKEAMENRIKSMSTVHEMLYESDNLGGIELGAYARRLVDLVSCSAPVAVKVSVDADDAPCSLDTAVPFGLLLNELVTNAYKHAFRDRAGGTLRVTLRVEGRLATLGVEDDGPGLPPGFAVSESSSLGLRLAGVLAEQLGGSLAWGAGPGARFIVRFRIDAFRKA